MKRSLLALLLALSIPCAALCGCAGAQQEQSEPVSIWYIEDASITPALDAMLAEYNGALGKGETAVSARSFEGENELAAALELMRPDLLLCSHSKAEDLHARSLLSDISANAADIGPDYIESLSDSSDCVGASFFPLGCAVYVLACSDALCASYGADTLEALCISSAKYYESTGLPFFAVESFSDLFFSCMDNLGQSFHADRRADLRSESFKYIYNLLSDAVYNHGMDALAPDPAQLLIDGGLACAVISSMRARLLPDGFSLAASPRVSGSGSVCQARVLGLAVTATESDRLEAAGGFLRWMLGAQQLSALCDGAGLMSVVQGGGSGYGAELAQLYEGYSLYMVPEDSEFFENRADFDSAFRSAMQYVA